MGLGPAGFRTRQHPFRPARIAAMPAEERPGTGQGTDPRGIVLDLLQINNR